MFVSGVLGRIFGTGSRSIGLWENLTLRYFLNLQSYRNISTVFKFRMRAWTVYVEQMWEVKKAYKI